VMATLLFGRLRPGRSLLLALASFALPWSVWLILPAELPSPLPFRIGGAQVVLFTAAMYLAVTLAVAAFSRSPLIPHAHRPQLRLRVTRAAVSLGLLGAAGLLAAALALPATWLGRVGVPLEAVARTAVWLWPAYALQAAAQEVAFRGVLMGSLERLFTARQANLLQALVFAGSHVAVQYEGVALTLVPITFLVGLAFGWLVQRSNSLWAPVIIHAAVEIGIGAAVIPGLYGG
jgi:membrane protease YdiL (CAAX protease family)